MVDITPFFGVIIGAVISAVVGFLTALITNRGHDRRLKIQLFNNEQKEQIASLHQLVMNSSKDVWEWWRNISKYLDTFEAKAFLPQEEMAWARGLIKSVEEKMFKTYPEDADMDSMEKEIDEQDKEQWLETLDEEQLKVYEIQEYMADVKRSASSHLVRSVSSLPNPEGLSTSLRKRIRLPHFPRLRFRRGKRQRKQPT